MTAHPLTVCFPGRLGPGFFLLLVLAACGPEEPGAVTAANYVGDAVCTSCHMEQQGHARTAHRWTSAPAGSETVRGGFGTADNTLASVNPNLHYRMEARAEGLYQIAVTERGPDGADTVAARFDLVTGSGRKGQSYLHWDGDRLFQLPISYWTALDDWILSPGYRPGVARFDRPIHPRCLECHATLFETPEPAAAPNQFDTTSYVLGITCEKCHGGGREHVERQGSWIRRVVGQAIVNPATLPRQRQLDACALCHGGVGEPIRPSFTYPPGGPLDEFLRRPPPGPDEAVDVHGNQVALLERSPCFQGSATMTCSTCHDVHQTQRDAAAFTPTCLSCHQPERCGLFPEHGDRLAENCVDCHMPELPTRSVIAQRDGSPFRPAVRTHWIRVYPERRVP